MYLRLRNTLLPVLMAGLVLSCKDSVPNWKTSEFDTLRVPSDLTLQEVIGANYQAYSTTLARDRSPNVVVMLVDDLGMADLGAFGSPRWNTPNLDRLASQSVRFTQAYSYPSCSPTRAALLSGVNPARLNITNWLPGFEPAKEGKLLEHPLTDALPFHTYTLAEVFAQAGYHTAHVGKWHLGRNMHQMPQQHGFEYSYMVHPSNSENWFVGQKGEEFQGLFPTDAPNREYLTRHLMDKVEDWVALQGDHPFFLYLPTFAVHVPIQATDSLYEHFKAQGFSGDPDARHNAHYAGMVTLLDEAVGRMMALLDRQGIADNTIFLFVSDNGGDVRYTENVPFRGGKGGLLEGGIRVPMLMRLPNQMMAGQSFDLPLITHDLYPTLLELAGVPIPRRIKYDGVSFAAPLMNQTGVAHREALFWHFPHHNGWYPQGVPSSAVRVGPYKLTHFLVSDTYALYHVVDDPGEEVNLAEAEPERVRELRRRLSFWRRLAKVKMPYPNPEWEGAKPKIETPQPNS